MSDPWGFTLGQRTERREESKPNTVYRALQQYVLLVSMKQCFSALLCQNASDKSQVLHWNSCMLLVCEYLGGIKVGSASLGAGRYWVPRQGIHIKTQGHEGGCAVIPFWDISLMSVAVCLTLTSSQWGTVTANTCWCWRWLFEAIPTHHTQFSYASHFVLNMWAFGPEC